ncbi:MAG: type II secretion system protein [Pyrinomonadaceae bacterium]
MMTTMEIIKKVVSGQWSVVSWRKANKGQRTKDKGQKGMSLIAVMAVMTLFAIALLAVAPTVQQGVQREKELEQIRRGEEVADAIKQYVIFYNGKLPDSIDDLLEGLPQGTKKRQILRPSAAIDPLSADGKWRLIKPTDTAFLNFGKRVQIYNNGVLPSSPGQIFDRYALPLVNIINSQSDSDVKEADEGEIEVATDKTPFIGVASQSRSSSVIAYYGIENHSKWIFTPLFRSTGVSAVRPGSPNSVNSGGQRNNSQRNSGQSFP